MQGSFRQWQSNAWQNNGGVRATARKRVYSFGTGKAERDGTWRDLLGGKGAGLAEMMEIGLPVPAGFTISTEACEYYYKHGKQFPPELIKGRHRRSRERLKRIGRGIQSVLPRKGRQVLSG